jgi:hypothetical protein
MRRLFVMAAALSLSIALVACGDDGGNGSGSGSAATDESTDEETISLDDWIEQADETCAANDDEVAELDGPEFDPFAPDLDDEQLDQAADYFETVAGLQQELLDELRDLPPPDEDAEEVTETLDLVEGGIEDINVAVEAARDGDADTYSESLDDAVSQFEDADEAAADLGLQVCGQDAGDNTGSTGDDPTGSGE